MRPEFLIMQSLKGGTLLYYISEILYYVYFVNRKELMIYRTDSLLSIIDWLLGIFKKGND